MQNCAGACQQAGGIPLLVRLLDAGPDSEVTEYAAAALGNLAAGGHELKDAIRGVRSVILKCSAWSASSYRCWFACAAHEDLNVNLRPILMEIWSLQSSRQHNAQAFCFGAGGRDSSAG